MAQTFNSAPQRIGAVKGETPAKPGLIGRAMGSAPAVPKGKTVVKEHFRSKPKAKNGNY